MSPSSDPERSPLPSPRVSAALVLSTLAFGAILGDAVSGSASADGGRRGLTIVVAAPAPAPVAPAAAPAPAPKPEPEPEPDVAPVDDPPAASDDDTTTSTSTPSTPPAAAPSTPPAPRLPPVKHVWLVALTGHSFPETFGPASPAPYLAQELRAQGTLLPWYHAAGHDPAAGGVALLGGQKDAFGPFDDKTPTLAGQLSAGGRTWKAYIEGATTGVAPGDSPCAVPPATRPRDPFLRFATLSASPDCGAAIAEPAQLPADVADAASAPAFSYILPGPAHDGSTTLADADAWLRATLPAILTSKAYKDGGLVVVTFDAGAPDDLEAGGGRVGALLLSPFVTPGGTVEAPYDPFALLATLERLFGLDPLGYAAKTTLTPFGPKVFGAWSPNG